MSSQQNSSQHDTSQSTSDADSVSKLKSRLTELHDGIVRTAVEIKELDAKIDKDVAAVPRDSGYTKGPRAIPNVEACLEWSKDTEGYCALIEEKSISIERDTKTLYETGGLLKDHTDLDQDTGEWLEELANTTADMVQQTRHSSAEATRRKVLIQEERNDWEGLLDILKEAELEGWPIDVESEGE